MNVRGKWDLARVEDHLRESVIPIRLAVQAPSGFPVLVSLWFLYDEGALWCAVQTESRIAGLIGNEGKCAFEVAPNEPPYYGVRGQGHADLVPGQGSRILERLMDRYLGDQYVDLRSWLTERAATETAIRIRPARVFSWDFSNRMRG